jgi:hypothetical protein
MTRDGTSKFRPADPALKLASGSNQPQPFERGPQSALADADIDIEFCASQVECGLIDLKSSRECCAAAQFAANSDQFLLLLPRFRGKDGVAYRGSTWRHGATEN